MKIDIPDEMTNDGEYICSQCERPMKVFCESGSTEYCPMCGTRNMDFEDFDAELVLGEQNV